jgi:hypothetical protein
MLTDGKETNVAFPDPRLRPLVRLIKVILVRTENEALGKDIGGQKLTFSDRTLF